MTIERLVISLEDNIKKVISRDQLEVGQTVHLGNKALRKEFLDLEESSHVTHKVEVKSHDQVVDKVVDSLDNGVHHIKSRDYINENPPWGADEEGNYIVIIWSPTVYGENGDGRVLGS